MTKPRHHFYGKNKTWWKKVKARAKKLEKSVSKYIRDLIDGDLNAKE